MNRYQIKNILVPTDFSETANHAVRAAIELAKKAKAKIILVHVTETTSVMAPVEMMHMGMINQQMIDAHSEGLKKLASKIYEEQNIKTEYKSYSGNVYDNIIRAAQILKADIIVMGTHGTSGVKEWLFGSNAFSVVNNSTVPVLTINQHSDAGRITKIVFPFNENQLTLKKLEHVIYLARLHNAMVLLFGYTESRLLSALTVLRNKADDIIELLAKENIKTTYAASMGTDYAEDILKFANESRASLISVITSRSHHNDNILKSKPDRKLVNHSKLPVLSVPTA